jgi:formate-nitrite transporter family protein
MSQAEDDQAASGQGDTTGHALSAASGMSDVSEPERAIVEAHSRPNAALTHEIIRAEGESELSREIPALLLSGLAAGLAMGFSLMTEGLLRAHLPEAPWRDLVSKLGYAVGFLVVVIGRQQLFTENTLTPILPLLYNRDLRTLGRVARLWGLVLVANTTGTWAISAVFAGTDLFPSEVKSAFSAISQHAIEASFGSTVLKGICAGWIIALMVWLLPGSGESRPAVIVLLTWLVSVAGFAHIVAGSVDASFLTLTGQADTADYLWRFFIPTLLGNIIGGVTLVAALNYGQVASEVQARPGAK